MAQEEEPALGSNNTLAVLFSQLRRSIRARKRRMILSGVEAGAKRVSDTVWTPESASSSLSSTVVTCTLPGLRSGLRERQPSHYRKRTRAPSDYRRANEMTRARGNIPPRFAYAVFRVQERPITRLSQ